MVVRTKSKFVLVLSIAWLCLVSSRAIAWVPFSVPCLCDASQYPLYVQLGQTCIKFECHSPVFCPYPVFLNPDEAEDNNANGVADACDQSMSLAMGSQELLLIRLRMKPVLEVIRLQRMLSVPIRNSILQLIC